MSNDNDIYLEKNPKETVWSVAMVGIGLLLVLAAVLYGFYLFLGPKVGGIFVPCSVAMAFCMFGGGTLPRIYREKEDVRYLFAAWGCLAIAGCILAYTFFATPEMQMMGVFKG